MGFIEPGDAQVYDDSYFENYAKLANTDIGRRLNEARLAMLARNWGPLFPGDRVPKCVVDIGIGAGTFCESRPGTMGYDVNPRGVAWLKARGLYRDPYAAPIDVACMWDALEHILEPAPLLANIRYLILVSLPIFRGAAHVLSSKHRKPGEHIYYWTDSGFRSFMAMQGWRCVETNNDETQIGREDIWSYAFRRAV